MHMVRIKSQNNIDDDWFKRTFMANKSIGHKITRTFDILEVLLEYPELKKMNQKHNKKGTISNQKQAKLDKYKTS